MVFEGAVISTRGRTRALSAINSGLVGILPQDRVAKSLGAGLILVTSKKRVTASRATNETPRPYLRRLDPCKRAKERKWMKKILGRYRCESNQAYFSQAVPNDAFYGYQYASSLMSLPAAWDRTTGANDLVVLVVDTGVQYTHPDLAANMWRNPNEVAGDGLDNDGNGYIDDVFGINAILNNGDPLDDHGHGTHVAGILGAHGNNNTGVAGVAWNTKIAAAKFLSSSGVGSLADAVKAIAYGTALRLAGNRIVTSNNSWGGGSYSSILAAAIQDAGNAGVLFVAAAGNSESNNDTIPSYPSSYASSNVLAVASTTSSGALSSFSNYGATSVDIAAPGSSILSTHIGYAYVYMSGTSMASPQVAGVSMLVQSVCGGTLTPQQVKDAILSSGQQYAGLSGKVLTSAIVNAYGAVMAALAYCPSTATPIATATAVVTNTAIPPTASPVASQTPNPPSPTATPAPPTPSATATPSAPTPISTPIAVEPTATSTPTPTATRSGASGIQLEVAPRIVSGPANVSISVAGAGAARSVVLEVSAKADNVRYSCPTVKLPLENGEMKLEVSLSPSISHINFVQMSANISQKSIKSSFAVRSDTDRRNNRRATQAAFEQLCRSILRGARAVVQSSRMRAKAG